MKRVFLLVMLAGLMALPSVANTNVLVSTGALRDASGNPLPSGALVVLVASTTDNTFSAPRAGSSLRVGETLANDDVILATWAVDAGATGVGGGAFRLVTFDYAKMAVPNLGPGDKLVLYWFPGATLANPTVGPNAAYGSYRSDTVNARSNMTWAAPVDTSGATLALGFLTDNLGGETPAALANASSVVDSGSGAPVIAVQPVGQTVTVGSSLTLSVTATGTAPLIYQWAKGTQNIAGATTASLTLTDIKTTDAGSYTVVISNALGSVTSAAAVVVVNTTSVIAHGVAAGSGRAAVGAGALIMSGAFTIEGSASKQMLVRAIGPSLAAFSVTGLLADPQLEIVNAATGAVVASNNDWAQAANATQISTVASQVGAFGLATGSKDAAILATLSPGTYRARVFGPAGAAGIAQLEIFEADTTPRLVYLATRASVGSGNNAFVQGFQIDASPAGRSYLIRALGPALGIAGSLADPVLSVYASSSASTPVAINDNWTSDAALSAAVAATGAMALPSGSKDAALNFAPPAAGVYTVQVTGAAGTTGLALLEIFESDAQRAANVPAAIVSPPEGSSVVAGQPATFGVVTIGKPAPTYQWRKNATAIAGATAATFSIAAAQPGDAASYDVVVTNAGGSATSPVAILSVSGSITHSADTDGNFRLGLVELTRVIELYNTRNGASRTGCYKVATGTSEDGFEADPARLSSTTVTLTQYHSADYGHDGKIGLLELTRVIELFNYRVGTSRTGQYHVQTSPPTEDGFAPGP